MCRSSLVCACEGDGPFERKVKEGLPNMTPSPVLIPDPHDFKVPEAQAEGNSLATELVQSQLALWTFSLSTLLTWIWQSRKRCLLFNVFLLFPLGIVATALLSGALAAFVTLGRFLFPLHDKGGDETMTGMGSWVVKRLPNTTCAQVPAGFLRPRRRLLAQQHSLRHRRFRALTTLPPNKGEEAVSTKSSGYFWQRRLSSNNMAPLRG